MRSILILSIGCVLTSLTWLAAATEPFPEPAALSAEVDFWERIYVDVSSKEGLLHDSRHLAVVYETLDMHGVESRAKRKLLIKNRKGHWRNVLKRLASGGSPRASAEKNMVEALTTVLGHKPGSKDYREAATRLRFQLGQSDRFKAGLIRAGAFQTVIRRMLRGHGVPDDLAHLPHVESSFQAHAYSKSGAAGMWQFIPSTGRRFLTIDHVLDERLSPMESTQAAARLLRQNYDKLGTWPLAITAYNHGAAGMNRAVKVMGSSDIATICHEYTGRYFGFASRNFYAQFLAARRVANSREHYFGPLKLDTSEPVDSLVLPFFVDAAALIGHLGTQPQVLSALNPALRESVWKAERWIPRGYELRLPSGTLSGDANAWIEGLPAAARYTEQRRSRHHTVVPGETLGHIARTHGTTIASLISLNGIANPNQIFAGQKLELN